MASRYYDDFPGLRHVFIVAIHVTPTAQDAQRDIRAARDGNADGIILIRDHNTLATNDDVLGAYRAARKRYPLWWIGINLLGLDPALAILRIEHGTSGLWFDNAQINESDPSSSVYLARVSSTSNLYHLPKPPLIMPSVAFKYQPPVKDFAKVVALAEPFADALVTSGSATGTAADPEKVRIMKEACKVPLGLASGVSAKNVDTFLKLGVDFFIVNTSISNPGTNRLDPIKVLELRSAIPRH